MAIRINYESMLRTGTVLHGNYCIDGYLSSGGFGNTYVATHIGFGEKLAIKEFFMKNVTERENNCGRVKVSHPGNEKEFKDQLRKFKIEANRLHQLNNEHIVKVFDLFEENNTAYYVMDYIDGQNLKELKNYKIGKPVKLSIDESGEAQITWEENSN